MKRKVKCFFSFIFLVVFISGFAYSCSIEDFFVDDIPIQSFDLKSVPPYSGEEFVYINNNEPEFDDEYKTTSSFEVYGQFDKLGRCTYAFANVGLETMPDEERGSIAGIKPTGWHTVKYDIVNGKYLYNRCHLIGYQLTGENANEQNLITCTRQTNVGAMLDFENEIADYIKRTGNHVLYRSVPIFQDDNLLASGIHLEGYSVEDDGEGIRFNVYLYNVQDGVEIDYATGESRLAE